MKNVKKEDLIWLAGFFEGDGTTGLFKYKRGASEGGKWRITTYFLICNNDPILISETKKILKGLGVESYIIQREQDKDKHNLNYQICCKNFKGVYNVLKALYPHLRANKKYIAGMVMEFIESRNFGHPKKGPGTHYSKKDFELYEETKKANQRGTLKKYKPSETLRQALANIVSDEKVQTSMKVGEEIPIY